jgi:hypothetical protein
MKVYPADNLKAHLDKAISNLRNHENEILKSGEKIDKAKLNTKNLGLNPNLQFVILIILSISILIGGFYLDITASKGLGYMIGIIVFGRYGIIRILSYIKSKKQRDLYRSIYNSIDRFDITNGIMGYIFLTKVTNNIGVLSSTYNEILAPIFDEIYINFTVENQIIFYCSINGKYGIYNNSGQMILPVKYDEIINYDYINSSIIVKENNKIFLINTEGKKLQNETLVNLTSTSKVLKLDVISDDKKFKS